MCVWISYKRLDERKHGLKLGTPEEMGKTWDNGPTSSSHDIVVKPFFVPFNPLMHWRFTVPYFKVLWEEPCQRGTKTKKSIGHQQQKCLKDQENPQQVRGGGVQRPSPCILGLGTLICRQKNIFKLYRIKISNHNHIRFCLSAFL